MYYVPVLMLRCFLIVHVSGTLQNVNAVAAGSIHRRTILVCARVPFGFAKI
jgi:hypothetical protein